MNKKRGLAAPVPYDPRPDGRPRRWTRLGYASIHHASPRAANASAPRMQNSQTPMLPSELGSPYYKLMLDSTYSMFQASCPSVSVDLPSALRQESMESIYQFVGKRLRERRLQVGLSQKALAEKADISVAFLSFLETGRRKGSLQTYADLARSLDLGLDQLFKSPGGHGRHRYQDPAPGALTGLSVAESSAVKQLVQTLRRNRKR